MPCYLFATFSSLGMSTVYERGIPPIAQDRDKARELWTKRTQL